MVELWCFRDRFLFARTVLWTKRENYGILNVFLIEETERVQRPGCFDAERAYADVEKLCYPRGVGTPAEQRAARYILQEFAAAGLQTHPQPFPVSLFPTKIGCTLLFTIAVLLVLAGAQSVSQAPLLAALCWGLAAFLTNMPWRVLGSGSHLWPPRTTSANLIACLPASTARAPARVVFMAHYDTKSQLLPTGVRVLLVYVATTSSGLLALLSLLDALGFPGAWQLAQLDMLAVVAAGALLGLLANRTGNRSPGAVDNGSSVGTLLELARSWRPQADTPLDVVWVASGSEEAQLNGARYFLQQQAAWWQEKPTLLINLESVGAGARTYLAGEAQAVQLAEGIADELGLTHTRLRVLGAGMDHEPFAAHGLPALSILGDVVRSSFALHSARDNMSLIEKPALERAGRLAACLAWAWAAKHQPLPTATPEDAKRMLREKLLVKPLPVQ